jgi:hypothetical protein
VFTARYGLGIEIERSALVVFITEMESVYSAVRTAYLNKAVCASSLKG